jgi:hypothetical protein
VAHGIERGAVAGAAGATALNAVTFLDMVVRARAASNTPERTIEPLSARTHVAILGNNGARDNRISGLGALTGVGAGMAAGILAGLLIEIVPETGTCPSPRRPPGWRWLPGTGR